MTVQGISPASSKTERDVSLLTRRQRIRIYPRPRQEEILRRWSSVCTWVYNAALEQRQRFHRDYVLRRDGDAWILKYAPGHAASSRPPRPRARRKDGPSLYSGRSRAPIWVAGLRPRSAVLDSTGEPIEGQLRQLQEARRKIGELSEVPAKVTNNVLFQLDMAYANAFRRASQGTKTGLPRARSARKTRLTLPSYRQSHLILGTQVPNHILLITSAAHGPKIGPLRVRCDIPLAERDLGELTIWEAHGQWHGSIVVRDVVRQSSEAARGVVGINRGLVHFCTLSTGERLDMLVRDPSTERELLRLERMAARKWRINNTSTGGDRQYTVRPTRRTLTQGSRNPETRRASARPHGPEAQS